VLASVPAADRGATALALWSSFASGLNDLLYTAAALAMVGRVCGAAHPEQGLRQTGQRRAEDCQCAGFRGTGLCSEVIGGAPVANGRYVSAVAAAVGCRIRADQVTQ
jgi:hypothetical protein